MTMDNSRIAERAQALTPELIAWRRRIHRYPELSFQEVETAKLVASELDRTLGISVRVEVGGTGVIGTLSAGSGAHIALRADMDALPILEGNLCDYRSQNPGVMHACGHDAHTAILLGATRLLAMEAEAGNLSGTVTFLFQPAEEKQGADGLTGALRMIEDGALDGVEAVLALHMNPELPYGAVLLNDGYTMASIDTFQGHLYGTGGHGAYPHLGVDPTWILLPVLQSIYGIVPRRVSPLEPAVISIGQIHAGTASNIIPSEVFIQGTIRSYAPEVREQLISELERSFSLATTLGGSYRLQVERGEPVLNNDAGMNDSIRGVVQDLFPRFEIHSGPFGMGAEDFSHMTERVPGAMFFLGCSLDDGIKRNLHTPFFDLDERCLAAGAAILAETAKRFLNVSAAEGKAK
ncbi:M20 metallopeptidase family protein [Salinithrix halophila]|uniref:M20 family metallopeptidase n=1 Tax=Salinithrix halophila TaxID=1485204 RepID=A0ABV8JG40_9BACL